MRLNQLVFTPTLVTIFMVECRKSDAPFSAFDYLLPRIFIDHLEKPTHTSLPSDMQLWQHGLSRHHPGAHFGICHFPAVLARSLVFTVTSSTSAVETSICHCHRYFSPSLGSTIWVIL